MAISLSLKEFEDVNLYSNANMERVMRGVVNASSNAALVSVFEDQVVLIDHNKGQFYTADYQFNKEKASFTFENFQPVEIEADESNFKQSVLEFFEDDDASAIELAEVYKDEVLTQERFIQELVNESLAFKDFSSTVNYEELRNIKEEITIANEKFYKEYSARLITHPLTEIKHFDWENPVYVSLMETEEKAVLNSSAREKANDLWKLPSFKKAFTEAAAAMTEDFEEGSEMFVELFERFTNVCLLDNADRKTLFGKTLLSASSLREDYNDILEGLAILFSENETLVKMINEADEEEEMGDEEEEMGDEEEDDPAMELTPEEMKKVVEQLKKVAEKLEDEKLKEKLDKIVSKLEASEEEEVTKPEDVKEAVSILNLVL